MIIYNVCLIYTSAATVRVCVYYSSTYYDDDALNFFFQKQQFAYGHIPSGTLHHGIKRHM